MKKVIGILFAVISVLFLYVAISAILRGDEPPNQKHGLQVSYYVGTFLPTVICLIISLVCLKPKKKKEVQEQPAPTPEQ